MKASFHEFVLFLAFYDSFKGCVQYKWLYDIKINKEKYCLLWSKRPIWFSCMDAWDCNIVHNWLQS